MKQIILKSNIKTPEKFATLPLEGKAAYLAGVLTDRASEAQLEKICVKRGKCDFNLKFKVREDEKDVTVTLTIDVDTATNLKTKKAQNNRLQNYYESIYNGIRPTDMFHCNVEEPAAYGTFKKSTWVNVEYKKAEKEAKMNKTNNPLEAYIEGAVKTTPAPKAEPETGKQEIETPEQTKQETKKAAPKLEEGAIAGFDLDQNMGQYERMRAITAQLEEGVRDFYQSDQWLQYLQFSNQFYNYSVKNMILLHKQAAALGMNLSHVGSMSHLNELGFRVRTGERALRVFAPIEVKVKDKKYELNSEGRPVLDENGDPVEVEVENKKLLFKLVPVYDISQTDAKPEDIPTIAKPLEGDMDNFEKVFEGLSNFAKSKGVTVTMEDPENMGPELGCFIPSTKEIKIKKGFDQTETIATLVHETAHSVLDSNTADGTDRNTREVRAESVAYIIMNFLGIDSGQYSFGYVATWAKEREPKELIQNMEVIQKTAAEIKKSIDKALGIEEQREKEKAQREAKAKERANQKAQAMLAKRAEITENSAGFERWEFENGYVVINTELNRVQIFFNEKPDYSIRKLLKSKGYHYAPSKGGAWMRKITENAIITTKTILKIA